MDASAPPDLLCVWGLLLSAQGALAFLDSLCTCVSRAPAGALPRPSCLSSSSPAPPLGHAPVLSTLVFQPSLPVSCFQVPLPMFPLPCPSRLRPQTLPARRAAASSCTSCRLQEGVSGCSALQDGRPSDTPPSGQRLGSRLQIPPWWSTGREIQGSDFAPLCDSRTAAPSLPSPAFADSPGGSSTDFSEWSAKCLLGLPSPERYKVVILTLCSQCLFRVKSLRLFPAFVSQCLLIVSISSSFHP